MNAFKNSRRSAKLYVDHGSQVKIQSNAVRNPGLAKNSPMDSGQSLRMKLSSKTVNVPVIWLICGLILFHFEEENTFRIRVKVQNISIAFSF
jgi:hypothetical protein